MKQATLFSSNFFNGKSGKGKLDAPQAPLDPPVVLEERNDMSDASTLGTKEKKSFVGLKRKAEEIAKFEYAKGKERNNEKGSPAKRRRVSESATSLASLSPAKDSSEQGDLEKDQEAELTPMQVDPPAISEELASPRRSSRLSKGSPTASPYSQRTRRTAETGDEGMKAHERSMDSEALPSITPTGVLPAEPSPPGFQFEPSLDHNSGEASGSEYESQDESEEADNKEADPTFSSRPHRPKPIITPSSSKLVVAATSYEEERLERIRRNQERLAAIGLAPDDFVPKMDLPPKKPKLVKKKVPRAPQSEVPTKRWSLRSKAPKDSKDDDEKGQDQLREKEESEEEEPEVIDYDDSSVLKYTCGVAKSDIETETSAFEAGKRLNGFAKRNLTLSDGELSRVYSVEFSQNGSVIVAGGHQGRVAVFGLSESVQSDEKAEDAMDIDEEDRKQGGSEVLFSFRAHSGWVSQVQFLSTDASRLITSGNDKALTLWDLSKARKDSLIPKELAKTTSLHSAGIFSMHEMKSNILTASKDSNVVLSKLTDSTISATHTFDQFHSSVVKCCRFRDETTFGSCGNDLNIVVVDTRSSKALHTIENAHDVALNSIAFHPSDSNLLISAAFDPKIHLWDLRKTASPLFTFVGHMDPRVTRAKEIYKPIFCARGSRIVASAQGSYSLSLYCTSTGATVSRGGLDFVPHSLSYSMQGTLAASDRGSLELFAPQWAIPEALPAQ